MKISMEIWGIPKGQGRPKSFRFRKKETPHIVEVGVHDPKVSRDWKDLVIRQVQAHRPDRPAEGPIRLICIFLMPMPKGTPKYKRKAVEDGEEILHTKLPDLDQLEKPIMDMLQNASYYINDSQVADRGGSRKIYAVRPGVRITVEEVEQRVRI